MAIITRVETGKINISLENLISILKFTAPEELKIIEKFLKNNSKQNVLLQRVGGKHKNQPHPMLNL